MKIANARLNPVSGGVAAAPISSIVPAVAKNPTGLDRRVRLGDPLDEPQSRREDHAAVEFEEVLEELLNWFTLIATEHPQT